jgi:hypothetical protein
LPNMRSYGGPQKRSRSSMPDRAAKCLRYRREPLCDFGEASGCAAAVTVGAGDRPSCGVGRVRAPTRIARKLGLVASGPFPASVGACRKHQYRRPAGGRVPPEAHDDAVGCDGCRQGYNHGNPRFLLIMRGLAPRGLDLIEVSQVPPILACSERGWDFPISRGAAAVILRTRLALPLREFERD